MGKRILPFAAIIIIMLAGYLLLFRENKPISIPLQIISAQTVIGPDITNNNINSILAHPHRIDFDSKGSLVVLDIYDVTTQGYVYKLTLNQKKKILIGGVGQGPGEYLSPVDISVNRNDNVYIFDLRNARVLSYDQFGKYTHSTKVKNLHWGSSFAINDKEEIYISNPIGKNHITKYKPDGTIIKEFGDIFKHKRFVVQEHWNIAFLEIDNENNLWASYRFRPLVRKYSPDGTLFFEKIIEGPEIEDAMSEEKTIPDSGPPTFRNYQNDICCSPNNRIFLTLYKSNNEGLIYELDQSSGRTINRIEVHNIQTSMLPLESIGYDDVNLILWGSSRCSGSIYMLQ